MLEFQGHFTALHVATKFGHASIVAELIGKVLSSLVLDLYSKSGTQSNSIYIL